MIFPGRADQLEPAHDRRRDHRRGAATHDEGRRGADSRGCWRLARARRSRALRQCVPATPYVLGRAAAARRYRACVDHEAQVCRVRDEPISARLMRRSSRNRAVAGELKALLGLTMLFIAHDLSMVRYVWTVWPFMYLGSLVEIAPPMTSISARSIRTRKYLVASNPQADLRDGTPPLDGHGDQGRDRAADHVGVGCRFAARCPKVMEVCRSVTPKSWVVADGGGNRRQVAVTYSTPRHPHRCSWRPRRRPE